MAAWGLNHALSHTFLARRLFFTCLARLCSATFLLFKRVSGTFCGCLLHVEKIISFQCLVYYIIFDMILVNLLSIYYRKPNDTITMSLPNYLIDTFQCILDNTLSNKILYFILNKFTNIIDTVCILTKMNWTWNLQICHKLCEAIFEWQSFNHQFLNFQRKAFRRINFTRKHMTIKKNKTKTTAKSVN